MIKTNPSEFIKFHKLLMSNADKDYIPWYFPVVQNNKAPDGLAVAKRSPKDITKGRGNWKANWARLSYEEALERLKIGLNVGLSARAEDPLIIIDIDDWTKLDQMPKSLINTSRKRCGLHGFFWKDKNDTILPINLPTEYGEIRSSDQYVVAAGSYCETSTNDIKNEKLSKDFEDKIIKEDMIGLYSVRDKCSPSIISYRSLPLFFKERYEYVKKQIPAKIKSVAIKPNGKHSALFDLTIRNVVSSFPGKREPHPLHSSDTGMNFSVDGDLAHCWRHLVSLNPIQFLCVKSGYMSCQDAGTGHKGSGAGNSMITGDNGAIFHAWLEAKKCGLLPKDDPIPCKAMLYIAEENKLIESNYEGMLNPIIYNKVLKIVEEKY